MKKKTIAVEPGVNHFKIIGVQEFGTVNPPEFTKTGWAKNTITELGEITIEFNPIEKTCKIHSIGGKDE